MKKTIRKWFWLWDFDKEEKWLNEMSGNGLQLCAVGLGKYYFDDGQPNEYIYRLELLDHLPDSSAGKQYISFIEETGAEHVGSLLRWVYFRKKTDERGFDLFSDINSRIKHLDRMLLILGICAGFNFFNSFNLFRLWFSNDLSTNLIPSIICLLIAIVLFCGFLFIYMKKRKLKKESILRE